MTLSEGKIVQYIVTDNLTIEQRADLLERIWYRKITSNDGEVFEKFWDFIPVEDQEAEKPSVAFKVKD